MCEEGVARIGAEFVSARGHIWTVNESIADLYEADYGKRPKVFRNIALCRRV